MALSLGVKVGSKIQVGEATLRVVGIRASLILVSVNGKDPVAVSDVESQEVLPGIFLQTGGGNISSGVRLVIRAPREVPINRVPNRPTKDPAGSPQV